MSVLQGDCLEVMQHIEADTIDMIYLDPPFFTQRTHRQKSRIDHCEYAFADSWASMQEYIDYMRQRLIQCKRVLKDTGNIFLHCDKNAAHYLRVLLDEIFGAQNFRNEIVWAYKRWTNSKSSLQSQHQTIYYYSKTQKYTFNTLYTNYSMTTNVDQILQARERNSSGKSVYKTDENGDIVWGKEKKGVPLGDVWDIPYLNPTAHERVGYPTQKPILLLERIISISTAPNDTVLDPFCGSGTTLVAAKLLDRNFVGIDISSDACSISNARLNHPIKTNSALLNLGEEKYCNKTPLENNILASLEALPVQRNSGIDGFLRVNVGKRPVPIKIQTSAESLNEAKQKLLFAANKRKCNAMVLIRTHDDHQIDFYKPNLNDPRMLVVDSLELSVGNWFSGLEELSRRVVQ
jgi:site-specific DNA-methyltransferase (adenine-specific)